MPLSAARLVKALDQMRREGTLGYERNVHGLNLGGTPPRGSSRFVAVLVDPRV